MPESPAVTEYIQRITQDWQVEICNRLRTLIHQAIPDVTERIYMTTPNYVKNGKIICVFFAAKSWVNFTVFETKGLSIPEGLFDPSENPNRMQVKIKKGKSFDYEALAEFLGLVASAV